MYIKGQEGNEDMKFLRKLILTAGIVTLFSSYSTADRQFDPFIDDSGFVYQPEEDGENFIPNDIDGHWGYDNIKWAAKNGYISGYGDGSFRPDNYVTREEAAKILSLGRKFSRHSLTLTDVKDRWSTEYISFMLRREYINGYPDRTFRPENTITRAELASIARKIMVPDIEYNKSFSDTGNSFAESDINELGGILEGYEDGSFRPEGKVTRAEIASVLRRLKQKNDSFVLDLDNSNYDELRDEVLRHYHHGEFYPIRFKSTRFRGVKNKKEAKEIVMDSLNKALKGTYQLCIIVEDPSLDIIVYDDDECVINIETWITPEDQMIADQWVDYISDFASEMTVDEKLKFFHDGIIRRSTYTVNDSWVNSKGVIISSPYSIISGGEGLCKAYAGLYQLFADRNNLPVRTAWGEAYDENYEYIGLHEWNVDTRFNTNNIIDLTWDDMLTPDGPDVSDDEISYKFYYSDNSRHHEMDTMFSKKEKTFFRAFENPEREKYIGIPERIVKESFFK